MKHTQGPWHLSDPKFVGKWAGFNTMQGKCYGIYATNEDLEAIALVPKDWMLTAKEQDNEANAKLIAAAPDLLEALAFITNVAKGKANDKTRVISLNLERDTLLTWLKQAEAAINKAL